MTTHKVYEQQLLQQQQLNTIPQIKFCEKMYKNSKKNGNIILTIHASITHKKKLRTYLFAYTHTQAHKQKLNNKCTMALK